MAVEVAGNTIRVPQGDTGTVKFVGEGEDIAKDDKGVFTLARRDGSTVLRKILPLNESDGAFHLPITYEDTAKLRPDTYEWSMRVVRGAVFDANGKLTDAQGQHTAVLNGRLIVLAVAGGAR